MELRTLRYFLAAAEAGSITGAAKALHLTQPTLSRQLRELEGELGTPLFERGSHTIRLTPDGELLKRRAGELLDLADRTREELLGEREELSGTVVIGGCTFQSSAFLSGVIAAFRKIHPGVRFFLPGGNYDEEREKLDRGLADFGVFLAPVDIVRYETLALPGQEIWCALVKAGSSLSAKSVLTREDLRGVPLISPMRGRLRSRAAKWLGAREEDLSFAAASDQQAFTAELVAAGAGAALDVDLGISYPGVVRIPLDPPIVDTSVLCWKKGQPLSRAGAGFLRALQKAAEQAEDHAPKA
jgi:DNA-binding transcriptional LysR family regulator